MEVGALLGCQKPCMKQDLLVGTGEKVTWAIQNWKEEPICGTLVEGIYNLQQGKLTLQGSLACSGLPLGRELVGELAKRSSIT